METALNQISVSEILKKLEQHGTLPERGFLAGGAVANTLLSIADGMEYPINDLDVFYATKRSSFKISELLMPDRPCTPAVMDIGYRHMELNIVAKDAYQVLKAYRKEAINFIKIRIHASDSQNQNFTILKGFDIDCCQAGIDLTTEQLVYTEEFREFLNTRQLRVTMPVTPYHTAIRLVKKKHELNAYCNIAEEMSLLMHVPKLFKENRDRTYDPTYAEFFGKRIYGLYKKYSASLDQYFTAVPYVKTVEQHIDDPFSNKEESSLLPVCKQIMPPREPGELYTLIPNFEIVIDEAFKDVQSIAAFMSVWTSLKRGRKTQAVKFIKAKQYFFTHLCSVANTKYVDCDFHDKHLKKIERFFSAHPRMSTVLYSLTIPQQLRAIRFIEKMADRYGMFVIGLIEHNFRNIGADAITEERIMELIDAYKREYEDLLIDPLDISEFRFQQFVREMTMLEELLEEGRRMHHCVGGYARALKENSSRIFHIEFNEESSTLEIFTYASLSLGSMNFSIYQHRGPWNKEVGIEHRKLGKDFVEFLDQKYGSKKMLNDTEQIQGHLFAELF